MHATQQTVFGEGTTNAETRLQGDCHLLFRAQPCAAAVLASDYRIRNYCFSQNSPLLTPW